MPPSMPPRDLATTAAIVAGGRGPRLGETGNPYGTADYIHELTGELSQLAEESGLDLLAYLLDMVQVEAHLVMTRLLEAGPQDPGPDER